MSAIKRTDTSAAGVITTAFCHPETKGAAVESSEAYQALTGCDEAQAGVVKNLVAKLATHKQASLFGTVGDYVARTDCEVTIDPHNSNQDQCFFRLLADAFKLKGGVLDDDTVAHFSSINGREMLS